MPTCQAPIQQGARKGEVCGNDTEETYCSKHTRQAILDKAKTENIRYCDVARGCYTVLEDYQSKCTHCLHKTRISDRKREDKKRQDPNLCLDCGGTFSKEVHRAKGKHDKLLRRCVPCYEKLQKYENQRTERERNYKAEAFTNKHIIWNHYVKGAKKRNINFALTKTQFNELTVQPCFYCSYSKEGEVNGIDRVDNNAGYVEDNVVTCCQTCNLAKGSQHPQEFMDKAVAIHLYVTLDQPIKEDTVEKWKSTYLSKSTPNYKTYQKSANSRNLAFTLSEKEFSDIVKQSCYLCGLATSDTNKNGIDRFNNAKGYLLDNCRSCCGHCNLLKKDLLYKDICRIAEGISTKYENLMDFISKKEISIRSSKTEARIRVETPLVQEIVPLVYKPLNEIIVPKEVTPMEITQLLEKKEKIIELKQWKTKQIYEAIQQNNENTYKTFCEQHNMLEPQWESDWVAFVLAVKGKTLKEAEPMIKAFVENLRRIRHNQLCASKSQVVEREDREQWPATTVVKAFLEGKLDRFKTFTEANTGETPADPKWVKRWSAFLTSLEENKEKEDTLKILCSKFMTAQRTKKYRKAKECT
jgi:hypothetical protein